MIILTNTTDKIQIKLSGSVTTNQLRCFASYRDTTATTILPLRNVLNTNDATAVDLVGSPAASTQRIVDYISVYNSDTDTAVVSISFNDNGTLYELMIATLTTGDKIEYQEGNGFKVISASGAIKTVVNQGISPITSSLSASVLATDVINNNVTANTIQDVTGLNFAVVAGGKYYFKFYINYSTGVTSTGSRWSISGPTFTSLCFMSEYTASATTTTRNTNVISYDLPALSNSSSGQLAGNNAVIEGYIVPSADGIVTARFASETSNVAITAKAGSVVYYQQLA